MNQPSQPVKVFYPNPVPVLYAHSEAELARLWAEWEAAQKANTDKAV